MNIYLDVNGVLIANNGAPAIDVVPFLKEVTEKHQAFWLTTHCKRGENHAVEYLTQLLPKEALPHLQKIKPTDWDKLKTEAIDFSKDFRWFDDYPMKVEREILAKNGAEDKLIICDASRGEQLLEKLKDSI
jgi:hypothetical protein